MMPETPLALAHAIARAARDAGGRALIVGGWARDRLLGRESKDIDLEVFGIYAGALDLGGHAGSGVHPDSFGDHPRQYDHDRCRRPQ